MNDKAVILLADDSKLVRFTGKKVLGGEFELLLAEDGAEAWQQLQSDNRIQLVLSDLQMPELDGFGLLQNIRQSDDDNINGLPVIMVTGAENTDEPKEKAMSLGATDFITKPFDHTHLIARVRAHIGHQQQKRSLLEHVNIDTVTGLLNREGFESRLEKDVAFTNRHQHSLAVMLLQLDGYRTLLERTGRKTYDKVIQHIAKLLQKAVRKEDTVGRAGLAQFLISLPTAQPEAMNGLAHRIAGSIEANEIKVNGEPWQLSLSIGVFTAARCSSIKVDTALQTSRQALEQSTNKGDGQVTVLSVDTSANGADISLDQLLLTIQRSGELPGDFNSEALLAHLKPLLTLLSTEQRQQLLSQ